MSNTADSSPGSLRQAILEARTYSGMGGMGGFGRAFGGGRSRNA